MIYVIRDNKNDEFLTTSLTELDEDEGWAKSINHAHQFTELEHAQLVRNFLNYRYASKNFSVFIIQTTYLLGGEVP